jgi:DNA-binding NarL/FixJ family response regulator
MLHILVTSRRGDRAVVLTPAENDVLRLLAMDLGNKEIASARSCAESTVKIHVRSLLRKLGAQSRRNAVAVAKERKLLGSA